jgi:hypothetical protein
MAASPIEDFQSGTHFHPVLNDPNVEAEKVNKVS